MTIGKSQSGYRWRVVNFPLASTYTNSLTLTSVVCCSVHVRLLLSTEATLNIKLPFIAFCQFKPVNDTSAWYGVINYQTSVFLYYRV